MLIQDFLGCRSGSACSPGSGGAVSTEALGESRRLAPGPSEEESPQRLPPGSAVSRPEGAKGSGHFLSLARRIYRCGWTQVDRPLPVYGCGWAPGGQIPPLLQLWVDPGGQTPPCLWLWVDPRWTGPSLFTAVGGWTRGGHQAKPFLPAVL